MATENLEIKDIVKTCKILLLDVEGTTTSISFVKDKLFPYVEENVQKFLEEKWEDEAVKEAVSGLRKLSAEDLENKIDGVIDIPVEDKPKEEQIEGLVKNVKWQMSLDRKTGALKTLQGLIWKQGYENGEIKGHIYDDVVPALEQWRSVDDQKVYIYSSGSVQAQKLLFGQSEAGDVLVHIDGHFDTEVGGKREATSYKNIVEKIGCKAEEILFLTDIYEEAKAAVEAGLQTGLVVREGNAPLPEEAKFARLQSFAQLSLAKKRKTEPEEEQPAKVAKTADSSGAPSATEKSAESAEKVEGKTEPPVEAQKPVVESMDVDEEATVEKKVSEEVKDSPAVVEEPLSPNAVAVNVAPVVAEVEDDKDVEMNEDLENGENERPVIEELPNNDEEPLMEGDSDIGVLNVSEILGKQCDKMLLEISNMENLVADAIKPMLESRNCEGASTNGASENGDSNDIVESILDKELEMEQEKAEKCEALSTDMGDKKTNKEKSGTDPEKTVEEVKPTDSDGKTTEKSIDVAGKNKSDEVKGNVDSTEVVTPEEPKASEVDAKSSDEEKLLEEVNDSKVVDSAPEKVKSMESEEVKAEDKVTVAIDRESGEAMETLTPTEEEKKEEQIETDSKPKDEPKVPEQSPQPSSENGNAEKAEETAENVCSNGNSEKPVNGDAEKDEELEKRLKENSNGTQNGTNEEGNTAESEVKGIKVKSVTDGVPEQQIEQAAEV